MRSLSVGPESALRTAAIAAVRSQGADTEHVPRTVTVARLLAEQGHVASARRVLDELLAGDPANAEALELAALLGSRRDRPGSLEPPDEVAAPPEPGDAAVLAAWFREALAAPPPPPPSDPGAGVRLQELLARVRRNRRAPVR